MKTNHNSMSNYDDDDTYCNCYKEALSSSLFVWGCLLTVAFVCLVVAAAS